MRQVSRSWSEPEPDELGVSRAFPDERVRPGVQLDGLIFQQPVECLLELAALGRRLDGGLRGFDQRLPGRPSGTHGVECPRGDVVSHRLDTGYELPVLSSAQLGEQPALGAPVAAGDEPDVQHVVDDRAELAERAPLPVGTAEPGGLLADENLLGLSSYLPVATRHERLGAVR